jgi:AcrR family transcriptional regulator
MAVKSKRKAQPKSSTNKPSPAVKERLEAAVLEVFSQEDFHKADMRTVAKKAGVSFETIYKYYGSKEKLLFAFVGEWLEELTDETIRNLEGISDTREKIRTIYLTQLDYYDRNPEKGGIMWLTIPLKSALSDPGFRGERLTGIVLDVLRQGKKEGLLNPNVRTGLLFDLPYGMIYRSFIMWVARGKKESFTSQADAIIELIWRGISKPSDEGATT